MNIIGIISTWHYNYYHVTCMMSKSLVLWASSPLQIPVMHCIALVDELQLLDLSLNIS